MIKRPNQQSAQVQTKAQSEAKPQYASGDIVAGNTILKKLVHGGNTGTAVFILADHFKDAERTGHSFVAEIKVSAFESVLIFEKQ